MGMENEKLDFKLAYGQFLGNWQPACPALRSGQASKLTSCFGSLELGPTKGGACGTLLLMSQAASVGALGVSQKWFSLAKLDKFRGDFITKYR